jgi:hypothetical protein
MVSSLKYDVNNPTSVFFNHDYYNFALSYNRSDVKHGIDYFLRKIYNEDCDSSIDYVAMHYDGFIKGKIFEIAESLQKKYLKDIEAFKRYLNSLKKNNYNADYYDKGYELRIASYKYQKDSFGDREGRISDEIEDMEKNPEKYKEQYQKEKEKFLQDMLYVEKNAVTNFTQFVNEWTALENFRLRYVNAFVGSFNRHAKKAITEDIYLEYKKSYPKEFADVEDPYPEYA